MKDGETVRLIRAFNVLRQYEEKDVIPAYEKLGQYVLPGGLMIEGTSNPFGSIWCANIARKMENESQLHCPNGSTVQVWKMESLVFSTNFKSGFDVEEFQTVLPKNLIHRVVAGQPIYDFFEAWKRAAGETSAAKAYGSKQWFALAAENLARKGFKIDVHKKWLSKGWLIWKQG